jgi:hypothetical protein
MTIKKGKKTDSDREKRVAQSLGDSSYVVLYSYGHTPDLTSLDLQHRRRGSP